MLLILAPALRPGAAPAGPLLYLGDANDAGVTVVDLATKQVRGVIPLQAEPHNLAVDPTGTRLYVSHANRELPGGGVDYDLPLSVVDTMTNTVIATPHAGPNATALAVSPSGDRVYIANYWIPGSVSVLDTASNEVIAQVPVGELPSDIAVSPDGSRVYVVNSYDDSEQNPCNLSPLTCTLTVSVIDTAVNHVVGVGHVGAGVTNAAVNPAGTRLYVSSWTTTYVFDLTIGGSSMLPKEIPVGMWGKIGFNPSGDWLYGDGATKDFAVRGLVVIDARHNTLAALIPTGDYGGPLTAPDGKHLYVRRSYSAIPSSDPTVLRVIDTDTFEVVDQFEVPVTSRDLIIGRDPNPGPPDDTPTPTVTPGRSCAGDCDGNGAVSVDELVRCVDIALGGQSSESCRECDADADGQVTVADLVMVVDGALTRCSARPLPFLLDYNSDGACLESCGQASYTKDYWNSQAGCCFYNRHRGGSASAVWCPSINHFPHSGDCLTSCIDPCQGL